MRVSDIRHPPAARGVARSINPAAGLHSITADEAELRACARASARSWQYFPYYEMRYGTEGSKFGFSDSAWIATLCERGATEAVEQIRWLGGLLSSRGMPQIMLEYHLRFQREEMTAESGETGRRCAVLRRCERALTALRRKVFTDSRFDRLVRSFVERAGLQQIERVGILLVSAVADEASGIEKAVAALSSFVCDPSRFPASWITAAEKTIAEARASVRR